MHKFSDVVQEKHFQIGDKMEEERVGNLMENWPHLENGDIYGQDYYKSLIESGIRPVRQLGNHRP